MARVVFPLFVLAREGGGDLVGRRRARRYVGAASQRFANGKHHHWHQETLDAERGVDAFERASHDTRVSRWRFQLLLLARSSVRRFPTVQFHRTFRFLCISSSYVYALQDTVVALRTYTTHEAGPHDDGLFVHHLCVLHREGRVRSVPPLFRSSCVNRTTAFFRFHPSCVHLFFIAGILASACVGCWFHVLVGFSPCLSFSSRCDASWRAFVSMVSSRSTWDGLSNLQSTSLSSRLASSPAMEHLRSTPLFSCRFHPLSNVAGSSSSYAHLVEPLLGCRCHGVDGRTRGFFSFTCRSTRCVDKQLALAAPHQPQVHRTKVWNETATKKHRKRDGPRVAIQREVNQAVQRWNDEAMESRNMLVWIRVAHGRVCMRRTDDFQDKRTSSTQENDLRYRAKRWRNQRPRTVLDTSG